MVCYKKKTKKNGGYEELVRCQTQTSAIRLYEYGNHCENKNIKTQIASCTTFNDLMAREVKYHRSCYQDLCRPKNSVVSQQDKVNCNLKLKEYIEEALIKNGKVTKVQNVTKVYKTILQESNIDSAEVDNRYVKTLLLNAFGTKLIFIQKKPGTPEYVLAEGIEEYHAAFTQEEKVREMAQTIKKEIETFFEKTKIFSKWPPKDGEITSRNIFLPPC